MTESPDGSPRPDAAAATRARLLAAARTEFAGHGYAGARVDRIADGANANKRMLYAYFGSKQGLFDAVVESTIDRLLDEVPFDARDLPHYASAYFDQLLDQPEALRLTMWRSAERVPPSGEERASYARKLDAIRTAQSEGVVVDDISAVDVLAMLFALTHSWLTATPALRAEGGNTDSASRIAEHREALTIAVRRLLTTA